MKFLVMFFLTLRKRKRKYDNGSLRDIDLQKIEDNDLPLDVLFRFHTQFGHSVSHSIWSLKN